METEVKLRDGRLADKELDLHDWLNSEKCPDCGGKLKMIDPTLMGFGPVREKFVKRCQKCNLYVWTTSPEDDWPAFPEPWEREQCQDPYDQSGKCDDTEHWKKI